MDATIFRGLNDKFYEKRKAAALDLEKLVRECHAQHEIARIKQIIDQLVELFVTTSNALHCRNGGLIGLAATAIALGVDISSYMGKFIDPLLKCFSDPESRIRYFACESMYNIAKVTKGEILIYFNPIFDSLSKLAADSDLPVKNGAELLDRLLKDIVSESTPAHYSRYGEYEKIRQGPLDQQPFGPGIMVPNLDDPSGDPSDEFGAAKKAFSLAHFMPLLGERIYVVNPFTRSFLVSWISVLDSVPDLELVSFLPDFLDGLLKYLSDPMDDVKVATENLLADFLREVREVAYLQKRREEKVKAQRYAKQEQREHRDTDPPKEALPEITMVVPDRAAFIPDNDGQSSLHDGESFREKEPAAEDDRDTGAWIPGQGVSVDHAAIVEILIQQLDSSHDEIQQSTALRWLAEFLDFTQEVMVPFTPRLIPAILPNLAHHVMAMQAAAIQTNQSLFSVIQALPSPSSTTQQSVTMASSASSIRTIPASPPPTSSPILARTQNLRDIPSADMVVLPEPLRSGGQSDGSLAAPSITGKLRAYSLTAGAPIPETTSPSMPLATLAEVPLPSTLSRPGSPSTMIVSNNSSVAQLAAPALVEEVDPFDYQATVNVLTIQFLSEHEETRVAALKWLIMLHQKAPKKILAMDDGTFPALLKTLSDPSEEVIKHDLQLLAQISSSSEESYFKAFMMNLLELFSTDRRLLENRGSLIIRQLCLSLYTERIYRTFAEILEKEDDLEFASTMVQKLNIILITSPELSEFRKRLKNLEPRDGQTLYSTLYRSWCHNPVAVFSLCLLAQAYEHAYNLLQIFADLEITVQLLVQIDKLVQLIESPVFTSLRLQLLEPEKYPHLFKCLYGLLMLLPQSSAFISLRNRLNAVSSLGFLHIVPRPTVPNMPSRSKIGRDEIKWQELLSHFRTVQSRHEKSRRSGDGAVVSGFGVSGIMSTGSSATSSSTSLVRPVPRRKLTNGEVQGPPPRPGGTALSPLNPKAQVRVASGNQNGLLATALSAASGSARPMSPPLSANKQRRALGVTRK